MRKHYTLVLVLFFLFLAPLASAGKLNIFDHLSNNESVKLVTFECHSNCTPEKWFLVDNLTIIKPYDGTHDIKIMITRNKTRKEFIPAKNLTPFLVSKVNWSNLENVTKDPASHDIYGRKWTGSFERMSGKIWSEGIYLQFHCSDCEIHDCLMVLGIICSTNAVNCTVASQVPPDCGMDMRYTGTTTSKTTKTTPKEEKLCGPALFLGLIPAPVLPRLRRRLA